MAILEEAFNDVKTFRISTLNAQQETGIRKIVEGRKDIFINLPTGFGKRLLYHPSSRESMILGHFYFIQKDYLCIYTPGRDFAHTIWRLYSSHRR